jgi:hypothetical protein
MGHVLRLAAEAEDEEAARHAIQDRYRELQHLDQRELSAAAEADRQDEMQELSDALRSQDTNADARGAGDVLLNSMLVLQQAVAAMSGLQRQGSPACAPQAMRLYKMLQVLFDRARTLHEATSGV